MHAIIRGEPSHLLLEPDNSSRSCYSDASNQFRKFAASRMPRRGGGGGSTTRAGTSARTAIGSMGTDVVRAVVAGTTALG
jgi:hypothetical protein